MTEIKIKYADVLAAARELAAAKDDERGWWRGYKLPSAMAYKLGVSDQWAHPHTSFEYDAVQRFQGQCLRAFNQLATEGALIKYNRGQRDAHGHYLSNETAFYTPAADKTARDEYARQQAETERIRREADEANAALAARFASIGV